MKEVYKLLMVILSIFLLGCGSNVNSDSKYVIEDSEERKGELQLAENAEMSKNDVDKNLEMGIEDLEEEYCDNIKHYMQGLVDKAYGGIDKAVENENCIVYSERDFEECRMFETNMVLDICGEKIWERPPYAMDEYSSEDNYDEPLGKYEYDEKYGEYAIDHYYGAHDFSKESALSIVSLIKKKNGTAIEQIRFYLMNRGAAGVMTHSVQRDYKVEPSFKDICEESICEEYMYDDSTEIWYWFDGEEIEFICDMKKVDYTYEYSVYAHCHLENRKYIVDEVIPLKMQ